MRWNLRLFHPGEIQEIRDFAGYERSLGDTLVNLVASSPKRGVGGSNPLWDARKHRCKPFFGV
ncbi:hypothetical protein, partial [Blautia luti]|uniref:hypothetical protein n=1 Tax=Blautia luti TaxID=89014 RepID=UPI001A9BB39E